MGTAIPVNEKELGSSHFIYRGGGTTEYNLYREEIAQMAETAERRPLVSVFRIVDDSLEELGLPGPFNVFPTPDELIHAVGIPSLDDLGESLKARMASEFATKRPRLPWGR